ncbi:MAG TPA: hypothetical protein VKV28_13690 [Candidatus Binataceae bacterium]|nr:hypothetical protein [Candidatus Binataceae bacterium]
MTLPALSADNAVATEDPSLPLAGQVDPSSGQRIPLSTTNLAEDGAGSKFGPIAAILKAKGATYCVLHGWEEARRGTESDVDIVILPSHLTVLSEAIELGGWRIMQLIHYEVGAYFFVATTMRGQQREYLCIDAITDFRHCGWRYLSGEQLLDGAHSDVGMMVAAPTAQFVYLLVKKILKGKIPPGQRLILAQLADQLGGQAQLIGDAMVGRARGRQLLGWIRMGYWEQVESHTGALRRALKLRAMLRYPGNPLRYWPANIKRLLRRLWCPDGLMLALLGPDGSGKSTLAAHLAEDFVPTYGDKQRFHKRPDIFGRHTWTPDPQPHSDPCFKTWLSVVKLVYLAIDYILGYSLLIRPSLVRSNLVIFDRYYTDLLIDPQRYRLNVPAWLVRGLERIIPRPGLTLILEAPATCLLTRKAEVSLDLLAILNARYGSLAKGRADTIAIDSSRPLPEVVAAAENAICDFLHRRYLKRTHGGVHL